MNARRCTLLLAIASSLVLASCAIKQPPYGADIMPESARAKIPGSWAGPHRSGTVVPNWIRNFGDPDLTALVADAVEISGDARFILRVKLSYFFFCWVANLVAYFSSDYLLWSNLAVPGFVQQQHVVN